VWARPTSCTSLALIIVRNLRRYTVTLITLVLNFGIISGLISYDLTVIVEPVMPKLVNGPTGRPLRLLFGQPILLV